MSGRELVASRVAWQALALAMALVPAAGLAVFLVVKDGAL